MELLVTQFLCQPPLTVPRAPQGGRGQAGQGTSGQGGRGKGRAPALLLAVWPRAGSSLSLGASLESLSSYLCHGGYWSREGPGQVRRSPLSCERDSRRAGGFPPMEH